MFKIFWKRFFTSTTHCNRLHGLYGNEKLLEISG